MKGKKCLLQVNRLHIAHCLAKVWNMKGHGKACSNVSMSNNIVSPDMSKHTRTGLQHSYIPQVGIFVGSYVLSSTETAIEQTSTCKTETEEKTDMKTN